ncbi:MAG TPA: toll/interleukin-1 receptor domain-containing protein [Pyrinomonadaceae bacterium]|nr:toll/interleukin-1 receptor domain-containing protein [Pyrinomonadaceae bacterium]
MANPEHLEILKQGVEVWNNWRDEHPEIKPDLSNANLVKANLIHADLMDANLSSANLMDVNLVDADLSFTLLVSADLSAADLSAADLVYAYLNYTKLSHTKFNDARLGYTTFADTDLRAAIGLETVKHDYPSEVGISTIYRSQGEIPEVFLRGCGVPENFITYMHSLTGQALEFYKCFISFTEADDAFSERLYNDLQMKGVRCWRWKEDAKWGKTLMHSIDEAVRLYDKLIIICSEQSLNSPAVIREIERALQKEDDLARRGKDAEVLFPIRLDDYIFTGWNHHRKADVTAKNVGDFRHWNEPEKYQKAFERLLRDLKAE